MEIKSGKLVLVLILSFCGFLGLQNLFAQELGTANDELNTANTQNRFVQFTKLSQISVDPQKIYQSLSQLKGEEKFVTRGASEVQIYKTRSPAVVLVFTNERFGSGSLIDAKGTILTNWHVISGYEKVGIIFKPKIEGASIEDDQVIFADVVRFDEVTDLALLKISEIPKGIEPIPLGQTDEIVVGADVHAIGHPTGESWTYTRGFISQLRKDYEWFTESGVNHQSDVIQTQTPINPGNSGGPLLGADSKLLGVNSFKASGEALNFAVSVGQVQAFLNRTEDRYAETMTTPENQINEDCEGNALQNYRNEENTALVQLWDMNCDGTADAYSTIPDDQSEPEIISWDSTGDGLVDTSISDTDRNGNPDFAAFDINGDGKIDLIGYYRDGEFEPYKYEEYSGG